MADRYYWLKLKKDFFKRKDIQVIEEMKNGKDYILFYLKLLCESLDHNGNLRFSDEIPYSEEMLSVITKENVDVIRSAIKVFTQLNMMELLDDGTIFMREVDKLLGTETESAVQKRKYRENLKNNSLLEAPQVDAVRQSQDNVRTMSDLKENREKEKYITNNNPIKNFNNELEKKEENIKEEKRQQTEVRHRFGEYNRVLLTDREYERLCADYTKEKADYIIKQLDEYVEQNNNKNKYTNFNLVIRKAIRENWFDRYKPEPKPTEEKSFDANEWLERKLQHNEDY